MLQLIVPIILGAATALGCSRTGLFVDKPRDAGAGGADAGSGGAGGGIVDECEVGSVQVSYSDPPGTEYSGFCLPKIELCQETEEGIGWHTAQEEVLPGNEICNNFDDDCDGKVDDDLGQTTCGQGVCEHTVDNCINGIPQTCAPLAGAGEEICDKKDNDCDGQKDEGFNVGEECEVGVGGCVNYGNYVCGPNGLITICSVEPLPSTKEIPCNNIDEDCNGIAFQGTDKDKDGYKLEGGLCGKADCDDNNPSINPAATEVCNNKDDNCNGQKDENLIMESYSGPPKTKNVGTCKPEIKVCKNGVFVITQAQVLPQEELCNGLDDNCNGKTDELLVDCICDPDNDGIITNKFTDPNFLNAVKKALGKWPNEDITPQDAIKLTSLNIWNDNVSNISGIECFVNLNAFYAGDNKIADISPLALTNLTELQLWNNQIADISPLAGLTNLIDLFLEENQISDVSSLAGLTNLTWLDLGSNQIADISPLAGLTNLTSISLLDNQIANISPLAGLTKLTYNVDLSINQIDDISPLAGLNNLTHLYLNKNQISDVSSLAGLTNLTHLYLDKNQISNISSLAGLIELFHLGIRYNLIKNITPLINNPGLDGGDQVWLTGNNQIPVDQINQLKAKGVTVYW